MLHMISHASVIIYLLKNTTATTTKWKKIWKRRKQKHSFIRIYMYITCIKYKQTRACDAWRRKCVSNHHRNSNRRLLFLSIVHTLSIFIREIYCDRMHTTVGRCSMNQHSFICLCECEHIRHTNYSDVDANGNFSRSIDSIKKTKKNV